MMMQSETETNGRIYPRLVKPNCKPSEVFPTRHLYVSGLGSQLGNNEAQVRSVFEVFGNIETIELPDDKRFVYVSYTTQEEATLAMTSLWNQPTSLGCRVMIKYAIEATPPGPLMLEPECTTSTRDVHIPGCFVFEEFISEEEEAALVQQLGEDDAPWQENLSRRVQHYGFPFNYRTLMVDYSTPTPPIPEPCAFLIDRMLEKFASTMHNEAASAASASSTQTTAAVTVPVLTQMTLNEYLPGQGIAAHIDTTSCFGDEVFIVSLNSSITMTMQKRTSVASSSSSSSSFYTSSSATAAAEGGDDEAAAAEEEEVEVEEDEGGGGEAEGLQEGETLSKGATAAANKQKGSLKVKKHLWLPRRSLLLLVGEARFQWSHGIASRYHDKVNGLLTTRQRRLSLTFRQAVLPSEVPSEALAPSSVEVDHVFRVYDNIAIHWNHTRGKRKVHWHRVKAYLETLPPGSFLADIGSGDGKYFGLNPGVVCVGCDRSWTLLQVSKEPSHETFCCDAVKLPLCSDYFDATICVAVLHHIASRDRRIAAVRELVRITRPGGTIFLQAWAQEQEENSRHVFEEQDVLVPWRLQQRFFVAGQGQGEEGAAAAIDMPVSPEGPCQHVEEENGQLVFQRFCHVYKKGELEDICSSVPNCRIIESGWDKGNWFLQVEKTRDERTVSMREGVQCEAVASFVPRRLDC